MNQPDKNAKRKYHFSEYNPDWKNQFLLIKDFLKNVFKYKALEIEHIGSTSIEGMKAKPLIDVLIVVDKMESFDIEKKLMVGAGYEWGEDYIAPNILIFFKLGPDGDKLENIHTFEKGSPKAIQFIVMRDYLRARPDRARTYSDLKEKNVALYPDDYTAYRNAKKDLLSEIEIEAHRWNKTKKV